MAVISVLALVVALAALALAARAAGVGRRKPTLEGLPTDVVALRREVAALRAEAGGALKHLAVVRYDAFDDQGGHLSWSLALLDDAGDGVVVSSIHGRTDARTYAKSITRWSCEQQLSPEEVEAISEARP